ncbi:hypothetical protein [Aeromonas allosaccharophila]|uniref:hypothetical protein n=1 Tax=Aeromonas allosaccharophila TaxID=656 RepID=UPI00341EB12D
MARRSGRRRKQGGAGEGLIVKTFGTLFILLVLVGSFLLFFAWWYFELKGRKLSTPNSIHDFDHTKEELKSIHQQESILNQLYSRLDQIEYEGQSISKRQDGMYNERSNKGKLFNTEIRDLNPRIDNLEQTLADLESLPEKRLNDWAFYASMHLSLRLSVISYVASFAVFLFFQPKWIIQLSQLLQNVTLLDFYASYPMAYGLSVGSLTISVIVLISSFFYLRNEKKNLIINSTKNSPSTDLVDDDNFSEISVEGLTTLLSRLSHTELKQLADEFNIQADRRSKANILNAISNEHSDVIKNIFLRVTTN